MENYHCVNKGFGDYLHQNTDLVQEPEQYADGQDRDDLSQFASEYARFVSHNSHDVCSFGTPSETQAKERVSISTRRSRFAYQGSSFWPSGADSFAGELSSAWCGGLELATEGISVVNPMHTSVKEMD